MERCCFMFFDIRQGVRGLGVAFFLVNLVLIFPIINGWIELLSPSGTKPPAKDALQSLYQRYQYELLIVATTALLVALLVNALLVYGSVRWRRALLLPWLVWYALLFATVTGSVGIVIVMTANGQFDIPLSGLLIMAGVLPLYWYWFTVVVHLYVHFERCRSQRQPNAEAKDDSQVEEAGNDLLPITEEPKQRRPSRFQCTLNDAVWYWAALNAAVMDTEAVRMEQEERPDSRDPDEPVRTMLNSLTSLEGILRHIGRSRSLDIDSNGAAAPVLSSVSSPHMAHISGSGDVQRRSSRMRNCSSMVATSSHAASVADMCPVAEISEFEDDDGDFIEMKTQPSCDSNDEVDTGIQLAQQHPNCGNGEDTGLNL